MIMLSSLILSVTISISKKANSNFDVSIKHKTTVSSRIEITLYLV